MNVFSWPARRDAGERFAKIVAEILQSNTDWVKRSGIEYDMPPDLIDNIRKSGDIMSRRANLQPDGKCYMLGKGMAHWEAKASDDIEDKPYHAYQELEVNGEPVLIFLARNFVNIEKGRAKTPKDKVYVGRVKNLKFHIARIDRYSPRPDCRVFNMYWYDPNKQPDGSYRSMPYGSGTPHASIDFGSSKLYHLTDLLYDGNKWTWSPVSRRRAYQGISANVKEPAAGLLW